VQFQQARIHARIDDIINIRERDVIACCCGQTGITGRRDTPIRLVDDIKMTEFTGVAGDDICRAVSRAVINNNKFQAVQILFLYAVKKSAQEISPL
jgi:hypothetical protein